MAKKKVESNKREKHVLPLSIRNTNGLALSTCYRCPGGTCYSGSAYGWSTCQKCKDGDPRDCTIGLLESFTKTTLPSGCVIRSDIFIDGRLVDLEGRSLASFHVKLILPYGAMLTAYTDGTGQFSIKVESALRQKEGLFDATQIGIGEERCNPEEQSFYALAIVPEQTFKGKKKVRSK